MDYKYKDFGKELKNKLKERKLSQREFADEIDASKAAVSNWINGKNLPDKTLQKELIKKRFFTEEELKKYETENNTSAALIDIIPQIQLYQRNCEFDISTKEKQYEFLDDLFIEDPCFSDFRKLKITKKDLNIIMFENEQDKTISEHFLKQYPDYLNFYSEKTRVDGKFGIYTKFIYLFYKQWDTWNVKNMTCYEELKDNQLMKYINNTIYYNYIDRDFLEYYKEKTGYSFFKTYDIDNEKCEAYGHFHHLEYILKEIKNKEYCCFDIKSLKLASRMGLLSVSKNYDEAAVSLNKILEGLQEISESEYYAQTSVPDEIINPIKRYVHSGQAAVDYNRDLSASCIQLSKKGEAFLEISEKFQ